MKLEKKKAILDASNRFFAELSNLDVAIAGAGPSGLSAAMCLAEKHLHVAVFERSLPFGNETWDMDISKLAIHAMEAGVRIMSGVAVDDLILRDNSVMGIVVKGYETERMKLHVDPLSIKAKYVVDATGPEASLANILVSMHYELKVKIGGKKGGQQILENTKEIYPGLFVTGMAANTIFKDCRTGSKLGDMLLSGQKCAEEIAKRIPGIEYGQ